MFQTYLDKSTPYTPYRWGGTGALLIAFGIRIFVAQGWYIGMLLPSARDIATTPPSAPQRHVRQRHPANPSQSHTRSASTSSTSSSPSCPRSSTPRLSKMRAWKTATPADSPRKRIRSSGRLCAGSQSSSSGTRRQRPSRLASSAVGSRSSTCQSSGRSWLCTG
jgi:hypothetical protein